MPVIDNMMIILKPLAVCQCLYLHEMQLKSNQDQQHVKFNLNMSHVMYYLKHKLSSWASRSCLSSDLMWNLKEVQLWFLLLFISVSVFLICFMCKFIIQQSTSLLRNFSIKFDKKFPTSQTFNQSHHQSWTSWLVVWVKDIKNGCCIDSSLKRSQHWVR